MSYEHCDRHNRDATNGCPECEYEKREVEFEGAPRPWRLIDDLEYDAGCLVVDAGGSQVCVPCCYQMGKLIVRVANATHEWRPVPEHPPTEQHQVRKAPHPPVTPCRPSANLFNCSVGRAPMFLGHIYSSGVSLVQCLSKNAGIEWQFLNWLLGSQNIGNPCDRGLKGEGGHFSHCSREGLQNKGV